VIEVSPIYETSPWGIVEQPWFLNQVARLVWVDGAEALLAVCLEVEQAMGRLRHRKNGPRLIDLDVLVVGGLQRGGRGLTVPHPGIANRRSVLEPWADVAPDLLVPGLAATLGELRAEARHLTEQQVREFGPGA
jgi:2-amino-4-hydroxy-6-hydroxymethyldihydropteridine diphosphokinase